MKKLEMFLVIGLILFSYSCSKDSNPVDDGDGQFTENAAAHYYPGEVGSKFTYSFTTLAKVNFDDQQAGTRIVYFTGTQSKNDVSYFEQRNVNTIGIDSTVNISFFRRTEDAVYFYIDTSGLASFIPDSVRNLITVQADKEVNIFKKSFNDKQEWSAYKLNILFAGSIPFNIIDVKAKHIATENFTLPNNEVKQAEKLQYNLVLSIPDLTTLQTRTSIFTAYLWYIKNIGVVKLEGNATVLQAIAGSGIDFDDTTRVMTQSLTSYQLK